MSQVSDTDAQLFERIFETREGRKPEEWERLFGLALMDGSLMVQRIPEAEALWRVHEAVRETIRAAWRNSLGLG